MSSKRPGSNDQKSNILDGFTVPNGVTIPNSQSCILEEEIVEVSFDFSSERFIKMVRHYYSLIEEIAIFELRNDSCDISFDEFQKYMNTILYSRIAYVRKRAGLGNEEGVFGPTDPVILIPDLLKCLINAIGVVRDTEEGFIFQPKIAVNGKTLSDSLLTHEQMVDVASRLRKYQRMGVTMWTQFHRIIDGDLDFMGFTVLEGKVMHYAPRKSFTHALLSSILGVTGIELIVRPRHYYGDVNKMDLYLASLIQRKSG